MIRFKDWDIEVSGKWAEEIGGLIIVLMILTPCAAMFALFYFMGWLS